MQTIERTALLAALALAGCQGNKGENSAGAGDAVIAIDGSSTVFPITEAVAEEFQKQGRRARHRRRLGHRRRLQEVLRRRDRDRRRLAPDQADRGRAPARPSGIEYIELPVAYDGLAVLVNPRTTGSTR